MSPNPSPRMSRTMRTNTPVSVAFGSTYHATPPLRRASSSGPHLPGQSSGQGSRQAHLHSMTLPRNRMPYPRGHLTSQSSSSIGTPTMTRRSSPSTIKEPEVDQVPIPFGHSAVVQSRSASRRRSAVGGPIFKSITSPAARLEYTFYIHDVEAFQRPFLDRRVEAVARSCQCAITLHQIEPGQPPLYYKGVRVLPVTVFARHLNSLKRCLARLDSQYPHFNVKAFFPPDII
ncbi:unnamed protein product [Protopolystoma xenopodis]|uniref:Uncharacterized protein n=1 Tax=Protopolystoma xenopodis TaxID=117903 RepID=A0A3S5ARK4_9PLAT|nr:unnamed protein product [Protopolystoma xenopodis]